MLLIDSYTLRARLSPALISIAPVFLFLFTSISWNEFSLPQSIALGIVAILFFGASDLGRRCGKRVERIILKANDGTPMATVLRHRDPIIDPVLKASYLDWLGRELNETPPTDLDEIMSKESADRFYSRCSVLLRERTRDCNIFKLLFEENVTYGFRRNSLGLKPLAILIDSIVLIVCFFVILTDIDLIVNPAIFEMPYITIFFAITHILYYMLFVTRRSVIQASDQYGRQLVLSIESLKRESVS